MNLLALMRYRRWQMMIRRVAMLLVRGREAVVWRESKRAAGNINTSETGGI